MERLKKNWYLVLIAVATLILAVIAIITATKLYQIGKEPVAPTVPRPAPAVATPIPTLEPTPVPECTLKFVVAELTPTPTPTLIPECWNACDINDDCPEVLSCQIVDETKRCVNSDCPEEEDCVCPEATPTPTSTPGPTDTPAPGPTATPMAAATTTPVPSAEATLTPTPPKVELPEVGIASPTLLAVLGGIILVIFGLLF